MAKDKEKKEINRRIGQRIKNIRKSKGMLLAELGARVGLSESTMYKYEEGLIQRVPIKLIENVAAVLHVSPLDILEYDKESSYYSSPKVANDIEQLKRNPYARILLEASRRMTEEDLRALTEIAKRMLPPEERDFFDID